MNIAASISARIAVRLLGGTVTAALAAGCYTPRYAHEITTFGDLNAARDKQLAE
jgi:hypothetical protein